MFELKPTNKWIIISPLTEDEKIPGSSFLIAPGNARERQHRLARIIAKDDCDETKAMSIGDLVFYDRIGEVEGRVGNQGFVTVKAVNVLTVIRDKQTGPDLLDQVIMETHG